MKINIIKNLLLGGVLLISASSLQSCNDDWLDLKPEGRPYAGDEVPLGGFEASAFGLYASLRTEGGVSDFL